MAVPDDNDFDENEEETEEVVPEAAARSNAGRRRRGVGRPPGIPAKPHVSQWKNKEADLMWGEMLEQLSKDSRTPYDLYIAIMDTSGVNRGSRLASFDASSCDGTGGVPPGEALVRKVEDFHMQSGAQGGGSYEIWFCWKAGSQSWGRGTLNIKPPAVIRNMRAMQAMDNGEPSMPPVMPQQGMGRPPPQHQQQPPQQQGPYYPPQYGYGGPWPPPGYYQPPPPSPQELELAELRMQVQRERETNARNQGMLEEIIRATREGRAPNVPPAVSTAVGVAGPPPQQDVATIVQEVLKTVLPVLGIGRPPQQTQAVAEDQFKKMANEAVSSIFTQTMAVVAAGMKKSITGLGAPPVEEEPEEPAEATPKPGDALPFVSEELAQTWADGRKVGVAVNKETGKIDWMGTAFANPFIAEKAVEVASRVGEAFAEAVKKVNAGGPHIVKRIPESAAPAEPTPQGGGEFGGGWTQ